MALTGAPFTASMRKMGARFPGAEKTSCRRTGVRWALCSAARMSLSRFRRWTRKNCPPGLRYRAEAEQSSETVALSVRCAARSALGDTAPRPAGKYGGLDTIKSRLSLSNDALR